MPLNYFLGILLVNSLFLSICNADKGMNISGKLIYTDGGGSINAISMGSSGYSFSSLYKGEEASAIDHLTRVNSDVVLFGECIVTGECAIKQYSLHSKKVTVLRAGRMPSYISNHDKLFFFDETSDGRKWLFVTSFSDIRNAKRVFGEPKWRTLPNGINQPIAMPVIQISADEVIFVGVNGQLWLYNIPDENLLSIDIKNCRPMLWRGEHDQLLCSDWDTWDMFLLDIRSNDKLDLPELKGAYGFVYIPDSDALIYGKTRSNFIIGETYDIFLYSFLDQKEIRIKKGSHIAGGVWMTREEAVGE